MEQSLHYLLMADHSLLRKRFFAEIQPLGLTPGQPKVLEYLQAHDGAMQKDIARGCCIEPATLSPLLTGMERRGAPPPGHGWGEPPERPCLPHRGGQGPLRRHP